MGDTGPELKHRDRHVGDVVFPDQNQVTAAEVVPVAQEVRGPELGLSEEALAIPFQYVIGEGGPALEDLIA